MLENKLRITSSVELANEEEKITKLKALELFDTNKIDEFEVGTFKGLSDIHKYLFGEILQQIHDQESLNELSDFIEKQKKRIEKNRRGQTD